MITIAKDLQQCSSCSTEFDYKETGVCPKCGRWLFIPTPKQKIAYQLLLDNITTDIGYGGSAFCFTEDTLIKTNSGYEKIKDIKIGTKVLSYDESSKTLIYNKVINKFIYGGSVHNPSLIKLGLKDGITIEATENHKFLFHGRWVELKELTRRTMEECSGNKRTISNKQQRKIEDIQLESIWSREDNESCFRQMRLSKIRSKGLHYQGRSPTEKLEACEIDINDIITIQFHKPKKDVYDLEVENTHNYVITKNDIIVHNSGKSWLGCFWVVTQCIKYPGVAYLIGRKELTNLKKTTLLTFFKLAAFYKLERVMPFKFNQQTNIIEFDNGSKIFLMDMSYQPADPLYTRFGGLELTGSFVDESNENKYRAIAILKTRLGRCKNEKYNIPIKSLETFNPSKDHVYIRYYVPYRDKKETKERRFIPALPTENRYVSEEYIEVLKNSDKITRERLLYGNFEYDEDDAALMDYNKITKLFINDKVPDSEAEDYLSVDVARFGRDKAVIIHWKGYFIKNIWYYDKSSLKFLRETIQAKCEEWNIPLKNVVIDDDGMGGGIVDELEEVRGFVNGSSPIQEANENLQNSKRYNYRNLRAQCYFKMAECINKEIMGCYKDIDPEVKSWITQELEHIKRKDVDKNENKLQIVSKEDIKDSLGRSPDFSDAIMERFLFDLQPSQSMFILDDPDNITGLF